jgi:hypothetical protein
LFRTKNTKGTKVLPGHRFRLGIFGSGEIRPLRGVLVPFMFFVRNISTDFTRGERPEDTRGAGAEPVERQRGGSATRGGLTACTCKFR